MTQPTNKTASNGLRAKLWEFGLPVLVALALIGLWHVIVTAWNVNALILPGPGAVFRAIQQRHQDLFLATGRTMAAAMTGLSMSVFFGTGIAFLFSQSVIIRRALYPYAVLLQTIPVIAIAPVVLVLFGRGFAGVAVISSLISLFPIVASTTTGLLQTDRSLVDVFRLNRATRWQTLIRLRVPGALPYLISGIRISSGTSIVGAIVGEFFVGSATPGLGALIRQTSDSLNPEALYATVVVAAALGAALFGLITVVGEWIVRRWFGMSLGDRP